MTKEKTYIQYFHQKKRPINTGRNTQDAQDRTVNLILRNAEIHKERPSILRGILKEHFPKLNDQNRELLKNENPLIYKICLFETIITELDENIKHPHTVNIKIRGSGCQYKKKEPQARIRAIVRNAQDTYNMDIPDKAKNTRLNNNAKDLEIDLPDLIEIIELTNEIKDLQEQESNIEINPELKNLS